MRKLIIDRSRWYRGQGGEGSGLLLGNGHMCCLGFHALACGYTEEEIDGKQYPNALRYQVDRISHPAQWLFDRSPSLAGTRWESALAAINDTREVDDAIREAWLIEGFRVLGDIEVEFIDGPEVPS